MPFPIEEIKKGLSHSNPFVREQALRYFTNAFSDDPTVMSLVVEAVQKLQWTGALAPHLELARLQQTPQTLAWFIDQLEQTRPSPKHLDLHSSLWRIVAAADVNLLRPHQERLLRVEGVDYHNIVEERLRLAALTLPTAGRKLRRFANRRKISLTPISVAPAERIVWPRPPRGTPDRLIGFCPSSRARSKLWTAAQWLSWKRLP